MSVTSSSSIIEREFSRVSTVVTKIRNRLSARSVLHFLQLKEHEDFKEAMAEKFRELNLAFDEDNCGAGDAYDLDFDSACFDENFTGSFF